MIPNLHPYSAALIQPGIKTRRASSWDESGGNQDWWVIPPHGSRVLADLTGPGVITHLWFTQRGRYRDCLLRIWWDDETAPSVDCPLGDFFCLGHGLVNTFQSLFFTASTADHRANRMAVNVPARWDLLESREDKGCALNCYAPMPFHRRARVELVNQSDQPHSQYFYIDYEQHPQGLPAGLGYFHAEFRRQLPFGGWAPDIQVNLPELDVPNVGRAAWDQNYLITEARGRGHYLGCNLSIANFQGTWWGEGDDMIWIDGYKWPPDLHGTGSEDYFGQAWAMQRTAHLHNGSSLFEHDTGGYQTSYVFHVENPVRFEREVRVTIEHGHANHLANDVASVAYFYLESPVAVQPAPPAAQRRPSLRANDGTWQIPPEARCPGPQLPLTPERAAARAAWQRQHPPLPAAP